ncbi:hypothetical protein ACFLQK_00745 [bacterium]
MAGIVSYGAYIPVFRLERKLMGKMWQMPSMPGERSVANMDEDSITMAVEAGLDCLKGVDPKTVDGLYFATTTAPYSERQCAAVIADALDLGKEIIAADFTGSLRSATMALRAACDAVKSGSAKNVLVVAADRRMAEPENMMEQTLGDAAAAILIGRDNTVADIAGMFTITDDCSGAWRRDSDEYVRVFEGKVDGIYGYMGNMSTAVKGVLEETGTDAEGIDLAVFPAPDARSNVGLGKKLGLGKEKIQDGLFMSVGHTGAPHMLLMLAAAFESVGGGKTVLCANFGDGADSLLLKTTGAIKKLAPRRGVKLNLEQKRMLPGYGQYLQFRKVIDKERFVPNSSPVIYWRDRDRVVKMKGVKCGECGAVQYPPTVVCAICGKKAEFESLALARTGKIHTFILDHLVGGNYLTVPIPKCSISLDDGSRVFLDMTDCEPKEVCVEMAVELTFRLLHEGAKFENYYWKCRPPRG